MDTYHRQAIALLAGAECAACPKDVSSDDLMQRVDIKFGLAVGTTKIEFTKARSDLGVYLRASGSSTWPEGVHRLLCESHAVKIVPVSATELADKEPVRNSLRCQFCGRREHRCDYIVHAVGGTGAFHGPSWLGAGTADDLKCEVCTFDEADQEKYLGAFAIGETCLQRLVHHHGVSTLLLKLVWRAQGLESGEIGHGATVDEDTVEKVAKLLEAMHTTHHDAKKLTPVLDELEFGDEFWGSVFRHVTNDELSADFLIDAGELGRRNLAGEWEVHDSEDEDEEDEEEEDEEYDWSDEPSAASKLGKRRRVVESDDEDDDLPSPPQRRVTRASSMSTSAARPPSKKKTKECQAIVLDDDEMDADGQGDEELDAPEEVAPPTEDEEEEDAPLEPVGEAAEETPQPPPRRSHQLLSDLLEVIAQSELDGERLDLLRLATEFQRLLFVKNNNLQIPSPGSPGAIEASKAITTGHELIAALSLRQRPGVHVEVVGDVVSRMCAMLV